MKKGAIAAWIIGTLVVGGGLGGLFYSSYQQKKDAEEKAAQEAQRIENIRVQDSTSRANQIAELEGKLSTFELYDKGFSIDTTLYAQGQIDSVPLKSARGPWGTQEHIYERVGLNRKDSTIGRTWAGSMGLNGISPWEWEDCCNALPEGTPMNYLLPPRYLDGFRKKLDSLMNPNKYMMGPTGADIQLSDASDYKPDTALTKSKYGYACKGSLCLSDLSDYETRSRGNVGMFSGD